MQPHDASTTRSRQASHGGDAKMQAGREELLREVEWLRERVENLNRELVLARKDCGRLATQLKQEEGLGREHRRKADDAVREAKALRQELDRIKQDRAAKGSASRTALSDAHLRSVRMAERRRRQQAESLMQAYKGLYEDQLHTQHASAESYRSLTRGYSRLSADNKALRRETAAVAAVAAAASDAAGTAAALIASSADMQQHKTGAKSSLLFHGGEEISRDERSARKESREETRRGVGRQGATAPPPERSRAANSSTCTTTALPVLEKGRESSVVETASYGSAAAESAAAVATAAVAVATAADALAEAATTVAPPPAKDTADIEEGTAGASRTTPSHGRREAAPAGHRQKERARSNLGRSGHVVLERCDSRERMEAADRASATNTDRPSTTETLACSPFSDSAEGPCSTATTAIDSTARAGKKEGGAAADSGWAPPADFSVSGIEAASKSGATAPGSEMNRGFNRGSAKGYAFPQETREEESFSAAPSSAREQDTAAAAAAAARESRGSHGLRSDKRGGAINEEGPPRADDKKEESARPAQGRMVAVPPVDPAPRWRGRSVAPGRLLASSASWVEAIEVDAPKRSTSPTTPRRGRWGGCVAWGGATGKGAAEEDGCTRIEPSSRARPHSI
ncbi:hypothetical protein Esi_0082_0014 [Ectocarpus siliculosus]|uniref:Uncharacterized protein n=1 Tax=Ectocarpus siliculosus TaxID=2880 RepID=D8LTG7_ECTSI|nr:hypothetical protein Esi_0082_0014 [Ectocarpus siliculosus]|eukprot:CBN78008.1 hypothetical protein Esi_0082_0014 [Ectocarpus siliculosus]